MAEAIEFHKVEELRKRKTGELESLLVERVELLHKTRFKKALGQLTESHLPRALRRQIAQIKTILNEDRG